MPNILSVGIDIGTSTTQVAFSRLAVENTAGFFSVPHASITDKTVLYRSLPRSTPLVDDVLLDGERIRELVAGEFALAGYSPADTQTGAAIITGESARKENAELVLRTLSEFAGDFVVNTAGPDLESIIAGKGSGAWQYSREQDLSVVNLDIGGGTTNIAFFASGQTVSVGCYDIGGRLVRLDGDLTVTKLSRGAACISDALRLGLTVGERASPDALEQLTDKMAELLFQAIGFLSPEPLLEQLRTANSSKLALPPRPAERLCFSGGVADLLDPDADGRELFRYGDIGALLGRSLCRSPLFARVPRLSASETIAATVIGAGTHTTTLSGSTVSVNAAVLPQKNLPVLRLTAEQEAACLRGETDALSDAVSWFLQQHDTQRFVLALEGPEDPDYPSLCRLASALCCCLDTALPEGAPVFLVLARDVGKALGLAVRGCLRGRRASVVLDGLRPENGGYLDLGKPLMDGLTVPVIIKTLIFG